jgi:glycosyltransferase involved in cell wall biosynthesis
MHYSAPPVVGGVESVIGHHARLLEAAGHFVRILAGRGEAVLPGIEFVEIPLLSSSHPEILAIKSELDAGRVPEAFAGARARIARELRTYLEGIDLLIAHNVGSLHKNLPLTAALMDIANNNNRIRVILWHHDLAWTTPRYRSELHAGFPWSILATAWPGVKRHVVVSELRRTELAGLLGLPVDEIRVIPNGVEIESLLKLERKTVGIIRALGLLEGAPLLLLPVRITRRKNIELALEALAGLRMQMPAAKLLVTGPVGPHNPANLAYLEKLVRLRDDLGLAGAAHFLAETSPDFLPDEVIADFYRIADGLLLTSQEEGFGIPVLEAGLYGVPIFCSDISPLRELAGDLADYFKPDEKPEYIGRLIFLRLKMDPAYQMRKKVRQEYSWERIYRLNIEPLLKEGSDT